MQINVECPSCLSRFQLNPDLLGKQMRCPICSDIFQVQEVVNSPPLPTLDVESVEPPKRNAETRTDSPQRSFESGNVGDLIPILDVESVSSPLPIIPDGSTVIASSKDASSTKPKSSDRVEDILILEEANTIDPIPTKKSPKQEEVKEVLFIDEPEEPINIEVVEEPIKLPPTQPPLILEKDTPPLRTIPIPQEVKWSQTQTPPPPQEVKWSESMVPPPSPNNLGSPSPQTQPKPQAQGKGKPRRQSRTAADFEARVTRPKRRRRLGILITMGLLVGVGIGFGAYFLKQYFDAQPERLFTKAKKEYEDNKPSAAAELFGELLKEYPDFPKKDEARFFLELSTLKAGVYSLTNVTNPLPSVEQWQKFATAIEAPEIAPFAERDRFGSDIWQILGKLTEDIVAKANKDFDQDKPDDTDTWIQHAESLRSSITKVRPNGEDPEKVWKELDLLRGRVSIARRRLEGLAQVDLALQDPDDDKVTQAHAIARNYQLVEDPGFLKRLMDAEKKIQDRVVYKRFTPPIAPKPQKDDGLTGLLFTARLDPPNVLRAPPAGGPQTVFFGLARGVLYALDESSGQLLWATRVGIDCETLPVRVPGTETSPEVVLVTTNDGNRSHLTARSARDGTPIWSQPLETPALGQPVLVGNRAFVALRDKMVPAGEKLKGEESGAILEVEIANGFLLGRISMGRPLASGGIRRSGTGQIYFTAESKGVYVFDVEKVDQDGNRLDPQLVGILNTNHVPGTLRGEPVLANVTVDGAGPSYLILSETDGLNQMKLQAFALPVGEIPKGGADLVPVEIKLNGWSWFAPYCDSEKLAVVTDRGEFGLFGINQAGNLDQPLFILPSDLYRIPDAELPSRGQVVFAEEGTFWILARGHLHQLRLGLDSAEGLKLSANGNPIFVGEPLHAPQVSLRKDSFVIVTQTPGTSACVATNLDLRSGEVRWQRQLGMVAQGDPIQVGDSLLVMDRDGGLYRIEPKKVIEQSKNAWVIGDKWVIATPFTKLVSTPILMKSPDGKSGYVIAVTGSDDGLRLILRRYADGEVGTRSVPIPAPLTGNPIFMGSMIVVPLANGSIYRISLSKEMTTAEEGPTWRNERLTPEAICTLAAISDEEFLSTDGNRSMVRWHWPSDQNVFETKGRLNWTEKLLNSMSVIKVNDTPHIAVADVKGAVSLWDINKPTKPIRIWRGAEKGTIPLGNVAYSPFVMGSNLGYMLSTGHLVCISPTDDAPKWVSKPLVEGTNGGLIGHPSALGDQLILTHRGGRVSEVNLQTGERTVAGWSLVGNVTPSSAPIPADAKQLLVPLTDGTLLLVPIQGK